MPAPLILIVEDEPAQREILQYNIEAAGFRTVMAATGDEALLLFAEEEPDLVLLDWMLPEVSGIEICRQIKTHPTRKQVPVIMLSARAEEADKVRGLDTGADDYVTKPYSVSELMARIRNQIRRTRPSAMDEQMSYDDISLNLLEHRAFRGEIEITIGPTEFRLLATLIEHPGRVWSRERLLDRVWGRDVYVDTRTVDVHIGRLRKALTADGGSDPIRTIRGTGYALG